MSKNSTQNNTTEYRAAAHTVLQIAGFALGLRLLSADELRGTDLDLLFKVANRHQLVVLTDLGLKKLGLETERFKHEAASEKRKSLLFDVELKRVEKKLEAAGISYMPLKGMIIKSLYPGTGTREMSDIDILYDAKCRDSLKALLEKEGYAIKNHSAPNHDVYMKNPFFVLEMHHELFDRFAYPRIAEYYNGKTFPSEAENPHLYCMPPKEQYAYFTAHAFIHYKSAGTGLRTLIDLYLYRSRFDSCRDESLLLAMNTPGIVDFEAETVALGQKLFTPERMTDEESAALDYYIFSGTHGNISNSLQNRISRKLNDDSGITKRAYIKERLTVSERNIQTSRFFSRHRNMVWLMQLARPFVVFSKPKQIFRELKLLKRSDTKK